MIARPLCHAAGLAAALLFGVTSYALAGQATVKTPDTRGPQHAPAAQGKTPAKSARPRTNSAKQPAGATLFVIAQDKSGSHIEPLVGMIEGRYLEPPSAESEQFSAFAERYYKTGEKYRVLFGGGEAGTATVKARPDKNSECAGGLATVDVQSPARINGLVMGLATNSATLGNRPVARRFPTAEERSGVSDLAARIFRQKGVSATAVQDMKTINMTATALRGDGKWQIIASFIVRTKARVQAVHHLFVIAVAAGNSFDVDLMRYARTTKGDIPEGASLDDVDEALLSEVLVDQVDLDGDKVGEVVTMTTSFEGATYKIYHRQKDQWVNIYEYYSYRCAY